VEIQLVKVCPGGEAPSTKSIKKRKKSLFIILEKVLMGDTPSDFCE
jgi:hypothetical protein